MHFSSNVPLRAYRTHVRWQSGLPHTWALLLIPTVNTCPTVVRTRVRCLASITIRLDTVQWPSNQLVVVLVMLAGLCSWPFHKNNRAPELTFLARPLNLKARKYGLLPSRGRGSSKTKSLFRFEKTF